MTDAVNPAAGDFEGNENASGPQDAKDFRKHLILEIGGFEVVENKDGKGGGKGPAGEG